MSGALGFWAGFSVGMVLGCAAMGVLLLMGMRAISKQLKTRRTNIEADFMMREALDRGRKFSMTVGGDEEATDA